MDCEPDKNHEGRRNSNTEYVPTKCRITKPPPPKPAANPLQFIKVAPCPLFQKAQEQIKKVEEIKKERKEIRDDAEDWQANLDNWKSSRRKRQEHVIERVVEVKKLAEGEKQRRKSKTFSEMIEYRSKGRHKFTLPLYEDSNVFNYGIGSSSSKTNSVEDTDGSSNIFNDKEKEHLLDSCSSQENLNLSNQSQCDEKLSKESNKISDEVSTKSLNNYTSIHSALKSKERPIPSAKPLITSKFVSETNNDRKKTTGHYTYEGAIQDYRLRVGSRSSIDESIFNQNYSSCKSKEHAGVQVVAKGDICKRIEVFESDGNLETKNYESSISRRFTEDFANTQSIKQRLENLEKCTDQSTKGTLKEMQLVSVKEKLLNFNKPNDNANSNNLNNNKPESDKFSKYEINKSHCNSSFSTTKNKPISLCQTTEEICDSSSSPETELYINKINICNRDLDNAMVYTKSTPNLDSQHEEFYLDSDYTPSTSSMELLAISSDREDSGIHTTDVSCSVSQADESVDSVELTSKSIILSDLDNLVENIITLDDQEHLGTYSEEFSEGPTETEYIVPNISTPADEKERVVKQDNLPDIVGCLTKDNMFKMTQDLLRSLQIDASENLGHFFPNVCRKESTVNMTDNDSAAQTQSNIHSAQTTKKVFGFNNGQPPNLTPVVYENIEIKSTTSSLPVYENIEIKPHIEQSDSLNFNCITHNLLSDSAFPLASPKLEPPKVKPPPPPLINIEQNNTKLNATQRIKKEIDVKRSNFLGLCDKTFENQVQTQLPMEEPPDINYFLQRESKLEKSFYKKIQEEDRIGVLSKVGSQDSGLDIDRGRLSSDTWCSSVGESTTPSHDRQDSDHTNSITSEEDEIIKKEREIIELVEKEEKFRDNEFSNAFILKSGNVSDKNVTYKRTYESKFNTTYMQPLEYLHDQNSEVLRVEQELHQLEQEELEINKDNMFFEESHAKRHLQTRHSLENICNDVFTLHNNRNLEYRRGLSEPACVPQKYNKCMPHVLNTYNLMPNIDSQYRKSMPDIHHLHKSDVLCCKSKPESLEKGHLNLRKSLSELRDDVDRSAFKTHVSRQPIIPSRPLQPLSVDRKDHCMIRNTEIDNQHCNVGKAKRISRQTLHTLSAVPRSKHTDSWIRPEPKNYNQHWLRQEAELRRLSEQQQLTNQTHQFPQKKHLPDSVIETLTRRVQNRVITKGWNPTVRRSENNLNKEYIHHQYRHSKTMDLPLPMPYIPTVPIIDSQERMLSVSGKKKCSYCETELGRGAAMIIESLCLFYHMECFKCCVCHVQLGDGLMGTDVRVRNEKLHCHNCYSSDDGVKFSCV